MEILRNDEYVLLQMEMFDKCPIMHFNPKQWSHNIFKNIILPGWIEVLNDMRNRGCKNVFSYIPFEDEKIFKLSKMLGMKEIFRTHGCIVVAREL